MAVSESARHDLCNGLRESLGADRAETSMTYLPPADFGEVATKADLRELKAELMAGFRTEMRAEFDGLRGEVNDSLGEFRAEMRDEGNGLRGEVNDSLGEIRAEMRSGFEAMGRRIDQVLLTLVAGLFVIVAGMIGLVGVLRVI